MHANAEGMGKEIRGERATMGVPIYQKLLNQLGLESGSRSECRRCNLDLGLLVSCLATVRELARP